MFLYITNKDSESLYPRNTASDFIVQLPKHLHLDQGSWTCGVIQCNLPSKPSSATFVTSDFVESSILGGKFQPVLAMTTIKAKAFIHVARIPVKRSSIHAIRIKLVNTNGEVVNMQVGNTTIVLEIRRHGRLKQMDNTL